MAHPLEPSTTMGEPHGDSSEELPVIPAAARPLQSPLAMQSDMFDRRRVKVAAVPTREAAEREYTRQMDSASLQGNEDATAPSWSNDSLEVAWQRQAMMNSDEDIDASDLLLELTTLKARLQRDVVRCISIEDKCSKIEDSISFAHTRSILERSYNLPRLRPLDNHQPADGTRNTTERALDGVVHGASTANTATGTHPVGHEGSSINMTGGGVTGGENRSTLHFPRRLVSTMTASGPSTATHGTMPPGRRTFMPSTIALSAETTRTSGEREEEETARGLTD